ncbi:MAG: hypothetical protein WBV90_17460, partial [Terrimicrobiaceae bacterium]
GSFGPPGSVAHPSSNHTIRMGQHGFWGSLLFSIASCTGVRSREFAASAAPCAEPAIRRWYPSREPVRQGLAILTA